MKKALKTRVTKILDKEYSKHPHWKGFIFWWLSAHGYDHELQPNTVKFTDGKKDGGIDAIAWPLPNQTLDHVLVIQSKFYGQSPTIKDIERFEEAIVAIHGSPKQFNEWLGTCRPELHSDYESLRRFRKRNRYVLITPAKLNSSEAYRCRKNEIEIHDADAIDKLERDHREGKTPRMEEIRINGTTKQKCIASCKGTKVWIFTAPVREFGRAYSKYKDDLFAGNIRYALQGKTAKRVREGIDETLEKNPHEFVFSHNGITISGDGIRRKGTTIWLKSASIVNGAQTVSYLGSPNVLPKLSHNTAQVLVKFVQADKPELLNEIESKVACRSNNQNKVDPSDLMTELPDLVSLQRYFRRHGFHLERKKGERKLTYGQSCITKERLCQVLASVTTPQGAVKAKSKQKLFADQALDLFADFDRTEKARAEALAWARVDEVFWETINGFAVRKYKKRAQMAQFASLRVFHQALLSAKLKPKLLQTMIRWHPAADHQDIDNIRHFLVKSCKAVIKSLLATSRHAKKNEPAFYKALQDVKPAVKSASYHARSKIRNYYLNILGF